MSQLRSSSSTAAAKLVHSSETSAASAFSATASLVLSCPSFSVDLVGSPAHRCEDGCLLLVQCVEVALDSRSLRDEAGLREHLQPGDPAAGLLELVLDRGRAHVRASCLSRSLTPRRLARADANALPGAAALLPALGERGVGARAQRSRRARAPRPWPGRRRARRRGSRAPGAGVASATTREPGGTGARPYPRLRPPRRCAPSCTRAWAATPAPGRPRRSSSACRWSSSASRRSPARERDRAEPGEGERRVVVEPDAPGELERAAGRPRRRRRPPRVAPRPTPRAAVPVRETRRTRSRPHAGAPPPAMAATVETSPARAAPIARMTPLAAMPQSSPAASNVARCLRPPVAAARSTSPDCASASASVRCAKPQLPRCRRRPRRARPRVRRPRGPPSRSNSSVAR